MNAVDTNVLVYSLDAVELVKYGEGRGAVSSV
jgi:hypothetical protein